MAFEIASQYAPAGTPGFPQNNFAATADPSASNDNTQGYSIGSVWLNLVDSKVWKATGVGTGAATWTNTATLNLGGSETANELALLCLEAF